MILYHGTTIEVAEKIAKYGFQPGKSYNWQVKSSKGFVFLSLAYAPFFADMAKSKNKKERVLIKCFVHKENLYPDDDFIMAAFGKNKYTEADLKKISLFNYKHLSEESLKFLGNAAALPKDVKILGIAAFNIEKLLYVCDPVISPINYKIMGDYYRKLTEWIYDGNKPEDFQHQLRLGKRLS